MTCCAVTFSPMVRRRVRYTASGRHVRVSQANLQEPRRVVTAPLLHRVAAGDQAAVRECLDTYGGLVWSLARKRGLPDADAEDAVQDVFAELWRSGAKFDPAIASEVTFVAMIARRRLIDARRKAIRHAAPEQLPADAPASSSTPPSELGEEAAKAAQALASLAPEQQRVLRLSVFDGHSHDVIAKATGLPLGTVKTHLRRGLIRLREVLGQPVGVEGGVS